ncbi:MAG TPA: alpha/beta fold hydrolase, partial [Nannocystis exedens]|nr:alpha/beta fold hydrolase [Nannocystis exedens]
MPSTSITFEGATGAALAGRLELPSGTPRGVALLAHCFTCSKDLSGLVRIAKALVARGFAVFRFDFTGFGESEGTLAEGNFVANIGDLVAAARYLEQHHQAPALLVGHSLGGTAGLLAAAEIPSVRALVTIGAPADPSRVLRLSAEERAQLDRDGVVQVSLAGRKFEITREFVQALSQDSMIERIAGLRRALLVIHAPRDLVVGIDNASAIFRAAKHPKSFISLDGGDHLLTRPEDANYVAEVISSWACRYIPAPSPEAAVSLRGTDLVAAIGREHYRTRMRTAVHSWIADEPAIHNGTDQGPTPYEMVMGGLA